MKEFLENNDGSELVIPKWLHEKNKKNNMRTASKNLYNYLEKVYNETNSVYENKQLPEALCHLSLYNILDNKDMFVNDPEIYEFITLRLNSLRGCNSGPIIYAFSKILEQIKGTSVEERFERLILNIERLSSELQDLNKEIKIIKSNI